MLRNRLRRAVSRGIKRYIKLIKKKKKILIIY
jgi:ribosomal protein L7Ae-like RNA K-turn-binding protein